LLAVVMLRALSERSIQRRDIAVGAREWRLDRRGLLNGVRHSQPRVHSNEEETSTARPANRPRAM
jgi:hypothetical protein